MSSLLRLWRWWRRPKCILHTRIIYYIRFSLVHTHVSIKFYFRRNAHTCDAMRCVERQRLWTAWSGSLLDFSSYCPFLSNKIRCRARLNVEWLVFILSQSPAILLASSLSLFPNFLRKPIIAHKSNFFYYLIYLVLNSDVCFWRHKQQSFVRVACIEHTRSHTTFMNDVRNEIYYYTSSVFGRSSCRRYLRASHENANGPCYLPVCVISI